MSGACEVMYCCCQPACVSRNLLCHGSAPGTIRIIGSSSYSRVLRYNFGIGLQDYLVESGSVDVEMNGNYIGAQGEDGLGNFGLYGIVTASITHNYVYSGYWIHYAHATTVAQPSPQVAIYGCGNIYSNPGIFTTVHETSSYGTDITYQGNWLIGGKFCDPCLNPGLLCRGFMMSSNNGNLETGGYAFQGTEYASLPPDPNISDVYTSTGTMTIEII